MHDLYSVHVPPYSVDSPLILSGYRRRLTWMECVYSIFQWHNQTVNIWSSLILCALNVLCLYGNLDALDMFDPVGNEEVWYVGVYWLHGSLRTICWVNSLLYHTLVCSGETRQMASFLLKLDYAGCYLTLVGIGTNLLYVELRSFPVYRNVFIVSGMVVSVATWYVSTFRWYQSEEYRHVRLFLHVLGAVPYLVGLGMAVWLHHDSRIPDYYWYLVWGLWWEMVAAGFYVSRFPECMFPRRFDCWLNSHSLWHWFNVGFDWNIHCFVYYALNDSHRA
jgi:adiponectin receptor